MTQNDGSFTSNDASGHPGGDQRDAKFPPSHVETRSSGTTGSNNKGCLDDEPSVIYDNKRRKSHWSVFLWWLICAEWFLVIAANTTVMDLALAVAAGVMGAHVAFGCVWLVRMILTMTRMDIPNYATASAVSAAGTYCALRFAMYFGAPMLLDTMLDRIGAAAVFVSTVVPFAVIAKQERGKNRIGYLCVAICGATGIFVMLLLDEHFDPNTRYTHCKGRNHDELCPIKNINLPTVGAVGVLVVIEVCTEIIGALF